MAWPSMLSYTNIGKGRWIAKPLSPALKCKHTWNPSAQSLTLCNILSYPLYFSPSPDLVDYNSLKRSNPTHNLQNAFNVAEQKLGVTKLLDPEGEWLWTLCFLERRRVIVSGLAGNDLFDLFSIFFYRCFHREPRWEVHHHLRRGILPLLLQDETTRCWGQENRKGELEGVVCIFYASLPRSLTSSYLFFRFWIKPSRRRRWSKSTRRCRQTCWCGSSRPLSCWTTGNLQILSAAFSSSFRPSTPTAL